MVEIGVGWAVRAAATAVADFRASAVAVASRSAVDVGVLVGSGVSVGTEAAGMDVTV